MPYIYWLNTISNASASSKFSDFFSHRAFFFYPLTTNTDIFIQEIVLLKDIYYYLLLSTTESWWYEKCLVWFQRKPWGRAVTESIKINLASLWQFQYLRIPIHNPVKHLWWSFHRKNSKLLSIFTKNLHYRCLLGS